MTACGLTARRRDRSKERNSADQSGKDVDQPCSQLSLIMTPRRKHQPKLVHVSMFTSSRAEVKTSEHASQNEQAKLV